MSFQLIARIENLGQAGFMAYIDSIKGMVEQADTPENAMKELLISLKVKLAYDCGIGYDELKHTAIKPLEEYQIEHIEFNNSNFVEKSIKFEMAF